MAEAVVGRLLSTALWASSKRALLCGIARSDHRAIKVQVRGKTHVFPECLVKCIQLLPLDLPLIFAGIARVAELAQRVRVPGIGGERRRRIVVDDGAEVGDGMNGADEVAADGGGVQQGIRTSKAQWSPWDEHHRLLQTSGVRDHVRNAT